MAKDDPDLASSPATEGHDEVSDRGARVDATDAGASGHTADPRPATPAVTPDGGTVDDVAAVEPGSGDVHSGDASVAEPSLSSEPTPADGATADHLAPAANGGAEAAVSDPEAKAEVGTAEPAPGPVGTTEPAPGPSTAEAGASATDVGVETKATEPAGGAPEDEVAGSKGPRDEDDDDHVDDDGGDDYGDEAEPPRRRGGFLTKQVEVDARMILIITAVFALLVGAFFYGRSQARQDAAAPGGPKTTATTAFVPPKDYVTFEDKETGVKMSFPTNWTQYSTKDLDPAIRLAVGIPDTSDTVVVRVNAFSSEITAANIADQKNVFDQLLAAEKIEILVNQVTTLKGLPALFYVYRFTDEATGIKGYHAHYFVFQGRKMVSVIFQALPEARYAVLAPVFDTISSTLEIAPGPPPAFLNPVDGGATTAPTPTDPAPAPATNDPAPAPATTAPAPPTTG